jgi:hypothetical protein
MEQLLGIFAYALDDETRDNEMVKLVYQRWTMATSGICFEIYLRYDHRKRVYDDRCVCGS